MIRKLFYSSTLILWYLLSANTTFAYTHSDTLRGADGNGREWWDIQHYDLSVQFNFEEKSIKGENTITLLVKDIPHDSMQIDLQSPMVIDKIIYKNKELTVIKDSNVWWIKYPFHNWAVGNTEQITIYYHGIPRQAVNPPWDGGFSWKQDSTGKPWIAVSCQGLGASVWWPCKDVQWDEPDNGMDMHLSIPAAGDLQAISNGRLVDEGREKGYKNFHWQVKSPINNYDATFYIGDYVHWHDSLMGENGTLDLDFWVLRYNEERARKQFAVVKQMIHCFEYWLGPYPFYEDGYKLVEAPYLGMEHQSAVAYGNKYKMGYLGMDRSQSLYGLQFDYIIIHESGHEWFGNSVTAKDEADNWIHEGITSFSESLFTECLTGSKEKGQKYSRGLWHNIENDKPVIGTYGVNEEGPGDIYDKGSAIMHMIRTMTNDDEKFRMMLRGLSKEFYHQTVTTAQVENFIAEHTSLDLKAFFNQYLRTTDIPHLEYYIKDDQLSYRFSNIVPGFTLPITATANDTTITITPTADWQHIQWTKGDNVKFSNNFLIRVKKS